MRVEVLQYVRPDGHTRPQWVDDMPDDLGLILREFKRHGLQLAAEVLTTGDVSFTIEYPKEGCDFDIEIAKNGPGKTGTKAALERLIRRFDRKAFLAWKKKLRIADDGLGMGWGA